MSKKESKNVPNWIPNDDDYVLVFAPVDGIWRELGHDIPKYRNMMLCDYLSELGLCIPDYTQFLRVIAPDYQLEYRSFGERVRIDYTKRVD